MKMARFVELTHENGSKLSVNIDMVISFAPVGGDAERGSVLSFGYAAGERLVTRNVRVTEPYSEVAAKFSAAK